MRSVCGGSTPSGRATQRRQRAGRCRLLPGPNSVSGSGRSHPRVHADSGTHQVAPLSVEHSGVRVYCRTQRHKCQPPTAARTEPGPKVTRMGNSQREVCIASSFELSAWGIETVYAGKSRCTRPQTFDFDRRLVSWIGADVRAGAAADPEDAGGDRDNELGRLMCQAIPANPGTA